MPIVSLILLFPSFAAARPRILWHSATCWYAVACKLADKRVLLLWVCNFQQWNDYRLTWNMSEFGGYTLIHASEMWIPHLLITNKWDFHNVLYLFCWQMMHLLLKCYDASQMCSLTGQLPVKCTVNGSAKVSCDVRSIRLLSHHRKCWSLIDWNGVTWPAVQTHIASSTHQWVWVVF